MSILKLKNRLHGLEKEVFGHHGRRIPVQESILVVKAPSSITRKELEKEFKPLKDKLREKYGDFDDRDVTYLHVISHFAHDEFGKFIPSPFDKERQESVSKN